MRDGFSLVELVVVIGILTLVLTMALFGVGPAQKAEDVKVSSQKFLSDMFSMQSKAINGVPPTSCTLGPGCSLTYRNVNLSDGASLYELDTTTVNLKNGVSIALSTGYLSNVRLCFAHPSVQNMTGSNCESCNAWACTGADYTNVVASPLTVTFNSFSAPARRVVIEGSGMFVTRMYEEPVP